MSTSRNARGVDIVIYSQNASIKYTIQVKGLSKRAPVPLESRENSIFGDFLIICRNLFTNPEVFVTTIDAIQSRVHKGEKNRKVSYWFQPKVYEKYKDNWSAIGSGY